MGGSTRMSLAAGLGCTLLSLLIAAPASPAAAQDNRGRRADWDASCDPKLIDLLEGTRTLLGGEISSVRESLGEPESVTPRIVQSLHSERPEDVEWSLVYPRAKIVLLATSGGGQFLLSASFAPSLATELTLLPEVRTDSQGVSHFGPPNEIEGSTLRYSCLSDPGGALVLVHLARNEVERIELQYHID